jgi:hypothetical protein
MHCRSRGLWLGALSALMACAAAMPASASAATTWVSRSTPSPPFNSCEHPAYDSIQEALGGTGAEIHVCAGTYAEQLTIERPVTIVGYGAARLTLPTPTANSTSPCDEASAEGSGNPDQDAISICRAGPVSIRSLDINAVWAGEPVGESVSCAYNLNGILVAGGSDLELSRSTVTGARPNVLNGCQYGVGVQIGMSYTSSLGVGDATLSRDTINGYEKNGITVEAAGSHAKISMTTVTGAGPTEATAQNGIGVQFGATAAITKSPVSGNECDLLATETSPGCGPDALSDYQADGVYFYEAGARSSVSKSTLKGNDVGVEAFDSSSADPSISRDRFEGDHWESVEIAQGSATVDKDVMRNGNVGIQLLQYAGQAYGPTGTGTHDSITGMSEWAVFGRSDDSLSDLAGKFTITKSKISGNPGTPEESVASQNPAHLEIIVEKDH